MRENYYNAYDIQIREKFAKLQKITTLAMILFVAISLGYFIYWLGAISDDIFMEYGRPFFEPLAKLLNLGATDVGIYKNTSIFALFAIIPTMFVQILLSKTQESLLKEYYSKQEIKRLKEQKQAQENYIHRFDSIETFSICLSIDYEAKQEISAQNKTTLNNVIYQKLANTLIALEPSAKISKNDVMIFTSNNFSKYDIIYDSILAQLAQIKNAISEKFSYKLIPSITTDAFSKNFNLANIKKQHFEIQTFNFKNRALTTATFAKKYKHLKHDKYAGIPIGEYVYFDNDKTGTYELNVIHKNLEKTLAQV